MIKINRHTLDNGLEMIHFEDKSTQMVALNTMYKVGSRNESPDHTGFAHLFEHLMFGGSVNIPNFDTHIENAGGENNAWTNTDRTNFYITVPRNNVETAFWLESDRMLSLAFTPKSLEVQRNVVMEEFKQRNINQPYGDIGHLLRSLIYKEHSYRWPTIGLKLEHIANATLDDVKDFFFRFYAPNNAVLAITGNISFDEARRLTEKWFGPIPSRAVDTTQPPREPQQTEERRLEVERDVPFDMITIGIPICSVTDAEYPTLDSITDILTTGQSARMIKNLVQEKQIFSQVDCYLMDTVDPGFLTVMGRLNKGTTFETAETEIWGEFDRLKTELVGDYELQKVKNKFESMHIIENENYLSLATNIAFAASLGDVEHFNREVPNYLAVTADGIREQARNLFRHEKCNTVLYKAKK